MSKIRICSAPHGRRTDSSHPGAPLYVHMSGSSIQIYAGAETLEIDLANVPRIGSLIPVDGSGRRLRLKLTRPAMGLGNVPCVDVQWL